MISKTFINTAPKMSRAIISRKRLSRLLGRESHMGSTQQDYESTPSIAQIMAETRKPGKTELYVNSVSH